ncbi:hypothetical protein MJ1HA_2091 [Metallosphaera sedula]|nr:hypothetical protein MJ1HA_2091 [Metallosphaera sedula]
MPRRNNSGFFYINSFLVLSFLFIVEALYIWLVLRGRIVVFYDTGFPLNPLQAMTRSLSYWNWPVFPGASTYGSSFIEMNALALFFQYLGFKVGIIQYLTLLFFTFLSSLGFYYIVQLILIHSSVIYRQLGGFLSAFAYSISPFFTNAFVSDLSGYIYSYAFFPITLYLLLKYISSDSKISRLLIAYTITAILFSLGDSVGAPPVLWWEIVIGMFVISSLIVYRMIKAYLANLLISIVILFITQLPFLFLYLSTINSLGFSVTHTKFLGNTLLNNALTGTFNLMSIENFKFLYYTIETSFSIYSGYIVYLLMLPLLLLILSILSVKDERLLKLIATFFLFLLVIAAGSSGLINPLELTKISSSPIISGVAYSFQYVFSLYPVSFFYAILIGLVSSKILEQINRKKMRLMLVCVYIIMLLIVIVPIIQQPPINSFKAFNYPSATSLTPVIPPLQSLEMFLDTHQGWYNVLISPAQWPGYAYDNVAIIPTITTFGGMILPASEQIIGGLGGLVTPILLYFPDSNYNFTNYFLLLGVKYVIINTHAYPGPGSVLTPPYQPYLNGFNISANGFNVDGMEKVLNQEGAELVANYSLFLIYKMPSNPLMIYASNGIPFNFSESNACINMFMLYANNTYRVYNVSLINNTVEITNVNANNVKISYIYYNSDHYQANINASVPFYLIFDQGFSPNWKLIFENGTVNIHHYLANDFANSWLMPKGNYSVSIEYQPKYHLFSEIRVIYISLATMVIMIWVLKLIYYSRRPSKS